MYNCFVVGVAKQVRTPSDAYAVDSRSVITEFGKATVNMGLGEEGDKIYQYGWYSETDGFITSTLVHTPEAALVPTGRFTADDLIAHIRESEKVAKARLGADEVFFFTFVQKPKESREILKEQIENEA